MEKAYIVVYLNRVIIVRSYEYIQFMKSLRREEQMPILEDLIEKNPSNKSRKPLKLAVTGGLLLLTFLMIFALNSFSSMKTASLQAEETFDIETTPIAAAASKRDVISIPAGTVKANPFLPYRSLGDEIKMPTLVNDVPKFDLIAPPEVLGENTEAAKIMDTAVSGILYDAFSPSAILKIDGSDYLVKKGDEINKYKIIAITKDSVTVKYGSNTYKAGIGEFLTEGSVKYNDVSNLNNKFGGEKR